MKKVNYIQSLTLVAILFLSFAFTANAANPKYVCDQNANLAVNLSTQVLGNGFSTAGGQWYKLPEGTYSYDNATEMVTGVTTAMLVPANKVSDVFLLAGKKPGKYEFVYVATTKNACIEKGKQRLATVYILESPKDISHTLSLCENASSSLDLTTLISQGLVGKSPSFTSLAPSGAGTLTGSTIAIGSTFEGEFTVQYAVTQEASVCQGPKTITVQVKRDGTAPTAKGNTTLSYCVNEVPATLNLNNLISATVTGGVWNYALSSGNGSASVSGNVATFDNPVAGDEYTFTYSWTTQDCYTAGSVVYTVKIVNTLALPAGETEREVCKLNNPTAVINMLRDGLGLDIPLSTGVWKDTPNYTNPSIIEVSDGLFEVANAQNGTYKYTFAVSNASELCGLSNTSAVLALKVVDPNAAADGNMQFCVADIAAAAGNVNLASYISGLPSSGVAWSTPQGVAVTGAANNELTYTDLVKLGVGTHKFSYEYNAGSCGKASGNLYLTVTDQLDMPDAVTVKYCRPDITGPINLTNLLGVDVPGTWSITKGAGTLNTNTFEEAASTTGLQTYEITFTPDSSNCGAKPSVITISISDDDF